MILYIFFSTLELVISPENSGFFSLIILSGPKILSLCVLLFTVMSFLFLRFFKFLFYYSFPISPNLPSPIHSTPNPQQSVATPLSCPWVIHKSSLTNPFFFFPPFPPSPYLSSLCQCNVTSSGPFQLREEVTYVYTNLCVQYALIQYIY